MSDVDKIIAACCIEELDEIHEELARFHARGSWGVIGDLLPRLRRVREQLCEDSESCDSGDPVPRGSAEVLGLPDEADPILSDECDGFCQDEPECNGTCSLA